MRTALSILFVLITAISNSQNVYKQTLKLMGSRFDISVVAENETIGNEYINIATKEIKRIEKLISSWDENSQTSLINKNAGIASVKVDEELFQLIQRSLKISKINPWGIRY